MKKRLMPKADDDDVLILLASLAVHAEELASPGAHPFDVAAINSLKNMPNYRAWMASVDPALLPVKRNK